MTAPGGQVAGGKVAGLTQRARWRMFLRSSAFDFLLVLVVSVALVSTVSYGFNSAATYRGNVVLIAGSTLPLLVALFAGSWSKRALAPSAIAVVVLAVIIVALGFSTMPEGTGIFVDGQLNDTADNYVIFAFILVVVPIVVYLLSRRTVGLVVLLVLALLACGTIQFLYRDWFTDQLGFAATAAVLLGVFTMFVYQTYRHSVYSAKRIKGTSFGGAFGFAVLISAACVLVGVAVFFGIVDNLGLSTPEVKPFERYFAAPVVEYTGTYDEQQIESEDQTTNQTDDNDQDTNQNAAGGSDPSGGEGTQNEQDGTQESDSNQDLSAYDASNWNPGYNSIGYRILDLMRYVLPVLAVLLFVGAILFQRHRRVLRLKRLEGKPYSYRVWYLYTFLMGRFRRLNIRKPHHLTPMEFAVGTQRVMAPFAQGTEGEDFVDVTDTYQRVCYGGCPVIAEEYDRLVGYYRAFFKNARKHVGKVKWLYTFWRI